LLTEAPAPARKPPVAKKEVINKSVKDTPAQMQQEAQQEIQLEAPKDIRKAVAADVSAEPQAVAEPQAMAEQSDLSPTEGGDAADPKPASTAD